MKTEVILILKVLDKRILYFVTREGFLPYFELGEESTIYNQISLYLKTNFNIVSSWLDLRFVNVEIIDKTLHIFYSSFVPKEFINEDNIKLVNDVSDFDPQIKQNIQQSLRLHVYK